MNEELSISPALPYLRYIADGRTQEFAFNFPIFSAENLYVFIDDEPINNGFQIIDNLNGGKIIFDVAPQANKRITLTRVLEFKHQILINETTKHLSPQTLKKELDSLLCLIMQVNNSSNRSLSLPISVDNIDINLPLPKAGSAILWNENANGLVNSKYDIKHLDSSLEEAVETSTQNAEICLTEGVKSQQYATSAQTSAELAQQKAQETADALENIHNKSDISLENINSLGKNLIAEMSSPDFQSRITLGAGNINSPNIALCNGFIRILSQEPIGGGSKVHLKPFGENTYFVYGEIIRNGAGNGGPSTYFFEINKEDCFYAENSTNILFIPKKGAL